VKLASWMAGGKRVTTAEAIERFLNELNRGAPAEDAPDDRRAAEVNEALIAMDS
jgi:hypothetical protein